MTQENKAFAIVPENLPLQLRIVGEVREEKDGQHYDLRVEDVETGRQLDNILAIEILPITAENQSFPEAHIKLLRPSIRMEVKAISCEVKEPTPFQPMAHQD